MKPLASKLPSFWTLQIGGWAIYLVVIYITFLTVSNNFLSLFYIKSYRTVIGFLLTTILWRIYRRMVNRMPIRSIILIVLGLSAIFGTIWAAFEEIYVWAISPVYDFYKSLPRFPRVALDYSMTTVGWSAIYFGIKYWQQWQTERENTLEANILAEKAQLEMLRYQLNPHFLFNALNSIRASVDEDKTQAKRMVTQLSEFLRHSLLSGGKKEIPLREELEAVRNYLAIEKIRFEEKLEVVFDVEKETDDFKVPCFLLNPLVENAVKHGLQTRPKPLKIIISAKLEKGKLVLEILNSGILNVNSNSDGTKIGLKNIRERLDRLFPGKNSFSLTEKDGFVSAKIEIRR